MLPSVYVCKFRNISINAEKRGCSGFVTHDGNVVYVNTEPCFSLGFLVRTARDDKDYTGGSNHFVKNVEDLPRLISDLLKQPHVRF